MAEMDTSATQPDISQIRQELRQIVSDVIGEDLSDIEDDAPLLEYVTSSLALVEAIRRDYDRFGVLISIRRVLEGQANLIALSVYIDQALKTQKKHARVAHAGREIPLAPSQQHIAFLARYSSGASAAYNESLI